MASSGMPWIKLYNEFLDDPKIGRLSDSSQLLFIKLLLVAGECDAEGALVNGDVSLSIGDLAWRLRLDETALDMSLIDLQREGLIDLAASTYTVVNFSKRQGRPQSVKREQWRERQQRKRDDVADERSVTGDTDVSHAPRERVEESREDKSREDKTPNGAATPPKPPPDKPLREDQLMWNALLETCHIKRVTSKTRGQLNTLIKWLRGEGYTVGDVRNFGLYWESDAWKRENRPMSMRLYNGSDFGAWIDAGKPLRISSGNAGDTSSSHAAIDRALQRIKERETLQ